jgi:hypothetical protein
MVNFTNSLTPHVKYLRTHFMVNLLYFVNGNFKKLQTVANILNYTTTHAATAHSQTV